jgi:hypothetical protein
VCNHNTVSSRPADSNHTEHIRPLLFALRPLHNFTVETQVQYFSPLAFEPAASDDGGWTVSQDQLKTFVNSAEWSLCQSRCRFIQFETTPDSKGYYTQHRLSLWTRFCISFSTCQLPTEALFLFKDPTASRTWSNHNLGKG